MYKACGFCGEPLSEEDALCSDCGASEQEAVWTSGGVRVSRRAVASAKKPVKTKSRIGFWARAVAVCVAAMLLGFMAVSHFGEYFVALNKSEKEKAQNTHTEVSGEEAGSEGGHDEELPAYDPAPVPFEAASASGVKLEEYAAAFAAKAALAGIEYRPEFKKIESGSEFYDVYRHMDGNLVLSATVIKDSGEIYGVSYRLIIDYQLNERQRMIYEKTLVCAIIAFDAKFDDREAMQRVAEGLNFTEVMKARREVLEMHKESGVSMSFGKYLNAGIELALEAK
ncbi:MAG: hypothetical protein ACOYJD_04425 [Christensenellales bacterium]|jgi:hypothetical protein